MALLPPLKSSGFPCLSKFMKVLLGMSGGVDSSVSAAILQEKGYEVVGSTMLLFGEEGKAVEDAKKVCKTLGIPHYTFDLKKEFNCYVIQKFINEYKQARTPNPCVECNKKMKFGIFYEKAKELGCDYIATGHYARIEFSKKYNQYVLRKSEEEKKDQTYFLYNIPKEELAHIIFPLQEYKSKEETRKLAEEKGLEVAKKKDSQEICFIEDNDYQKFLLSHMEEKPKEGNIRLKTGEILGKHKGLINYTIGQRKGIGISYSYPLYVVDLDYKNNEVIVGKEEDLYSKKLFAKDLNFQIDMPEEFQCLAKIRYRAKEAKAVVKKKNDGVEVEFEEVQRAITKGQSGVFYDEDGIVLGGGVIADF